MLEQRRYRVIRMKTQLLPAWNRIRANRPHRAIDCIIKPTNRFMGETRSSTVGNEIKPVIRGLHEREGIQDTEGIENNGKLQHGRMLRIGENAWETRMIPAKLSISLVRKLDRLAEDPCRIEAAGKVALWSAPGKLYAILLDGIRVWSDCSMIKRQRARSPRHSSVPCLLWATLSVLKLRIDIDNHKKQQRGVVVPLPSTSMPVFCGGFITTSP